MILNGEDLNATPLKLGGKQGDSLFLYLFNIVYEFSARAIKQLRILRQ